MHLPLCYFKMWIGLSCAHETKFSGNMFHLKRCIALVILLLVVCVQCQEDNVECYNKETKGEDYRGTKDTVANGISSCSNWNIAASNEGVEYADFYNQLFADNPDMAYESYCRNPDPENHDEPWCFSFVESKGQRTNCGVPQCETKSEDIDEDNSGEYKKNSSVFREVSIFMMALAVVMII